MSKHGLLLACTHRGHLHASLPTITTTIAITTIIATTNTITITTTIAVVGTAISLVERPFINRGRLLRGVSDTLPLAY
jgi:hypothetical protein